jgi:hypothetical protein
MDLWEIGWEVVDWMHLALDRNKWRAGYCEHVNKLVGIFFTSCATTTFTRRNVLHRFS